MATSIPYVRDFDPQYGTLVSVSDRVRRLTANNPGPFTAWGTNVYVVGRGQVDIIDPGPNTDEHFEVLIRAIGEERVGRVFVTHQHSDHSPMAHRLASHFGCQTYGFGPAVCQETLDGADMEAANDVDFMPDICVQDEQLFKSDGWSILALHTPGHTSNHVCYAVPEDNGLMCADHIMGWATSVVIPPDGDMGDYMHSLHKIMDRKFAVLWPGHGAGISDPDPFIRAYIAHRNNRNAQILGLLKAGQSQIKAMVRILYAETDPRLHPAASLSVLAHIIHMVKTDLVVCDGAPGLDSTFCLS